MIIPAFYDNQKVFLNTNYIVDIWDIDRAKRFSKMD